jgi:hypothetical protein
MVVELVSYFRDHQTLYEEEVIIQKRGQTKNETLELNDLQPFTPRPIDLQ